MSATDVVFVFANVIPIAVTDKSPVPFIISSAIAKLKMTITRTPGDFKNSGSAPESNSHAVSFPQLQPKTTEKIEAAKNNSNAVPSGSDAVKYVIISNANTANNTPNGSTTIPSHFNIFAG